MHFIPGTIILLIKSSETSLLRCVHGLRGKWYVLGDQICAMSVLDAPSERWKTEAVVWELFGHKRYTRFQAALERSKCSFGGVS